MKIDFEEMFTSLRNKQIDMLTFDQFLRTTNTLHQRGRHGSTPLILLVAAEMSEAVELLIERGVDLDAQTDYGATALRIASEGDIETVRILLHAGADPNIANAYGETPLMIACWHNRLDIVELLLTEATHVGARDLGGMTAVEYASGEYVPRSVRERLERLRSRETLYESMMTFNTQLRDQPGRADLVQMLESRITDTDQTQP